MIDILLCPECKSSKLMSDYTVELPYNETKSGAMCDLKGVTPTSYTDNAYDTTGDYKHLSGSGQHQDRERVVDQRLVIDRKELFAGT